MTSVLGSAFINILPTTTMFGPTLQTEVDKAAAGVKSPSVGGEAATGAAGGIAKLAAATAAAVVIVGAATVDMASKFQTGMTSLVTGAGEAEGNLKMISQGVLNLAPEVATGTKALTDGLYMIESAGYHGAAGLSVLKAAAEGAKVGSADLKSVSDALTSTMNAYQLKASDATAVTSELVATVAAGKMHMDDLTGALSAVLPTAAAAGISFAEIGGAIATMTSQGVSAQQATQNLANTIRAIQAPSQSAAKEMAQMGINSVDLAANVGKRGLSGTIDILVQAITRNMGPAGLVLQQSFNQSKFAAADAQTMLSKLAPSVQKVAQAFVDGTITNAKWRAELKGLPADQAALARSFATTENRARGFSDTLRSGSPAANTFAEELSKLTGGATGMNTVLELSGPHMATYQANIASVADAAVKGKDSVQGWALVQQDFGFKVDQLKARLEALGIRVGTFLIPVVLGVSHAIMEAAHWIGDVLRPVVDYFSEHTNQLKGVLVVLAAVVADVVIPPMVAFTATMLEAAAPIVAVVAAGVALGMLGGFIVDHWQGVSDAVTGATDAIGRFADRVGSDIAAVPGMVSRLFMGVVRSVGRFGADLIHGFVTGMRDQLSTIAHLFLVDIPEKILGLVIYAPILVKRGAEAIAGLLLGLIKQLPEVAAWLLDLPNKMSGFLGELGTKLVGQGSALIRGLWNGSIQAAQEMLDWVASIPSRIWNGIGDLFHLLFGKGTDVIHGLGNGIGDAWNGLWDWLIHTPDRLWDLFKDAIHWLWDAGHRVLSGLWNGMKDAWSSVTDWLGSLDPSQWFNDMNPQLGHADTVLTDTGHRVFLGLKAGMQSGWDDTTKWLNGLDPAAHMNLGPVGAGTLTRPGPPSSGNQSAAVVFQANSVQLVFQTNPTPAEAQAAGVAVGQGISDALASRNIATLTRTI